VSEGRDPRAPRDVQLQQLPASLGTCSKSRSSGCKRPATYKVTWKFRHKGKTRRAERLWCEHHAKSFDRKNGS